MGSNASGWPAPLHFSMPNFRVLQEAGTSLSTMLFHDTLRRYRYPCISLLLILVCYCCTSRSSRDQRIRGTSEALQALTMIITPTSSAWYDTHPIKHSVSMRSKTIKIQLYDLMRNVCAGIVELRDVNDLPDLFRERLRVYGWLVYLEVDPCWWATVSYWLLVSQVNVRGNVPARCARLMFYILVQYPSTR